MLQKSIISRKRLDRNVPHKCLPAFYSRLFSFGVRHQQSVRHAAGQRESVVLAHQNKRRDGVSPALETERKRDKNKSSSNTALECVRCCCFTCSRNIYIGALGYLKEPRACLLLGRTIRLSRGINQQSALFIYRHSPKSSNILNKIVFKFTSYRFR